MKIQIKDIHATERIRSVPGDIETLKQSIRKVGLLNPIFIDEKNILISGYRRLEAFRQLGWREIEAIVIPTGQDHVKRLDLEYHENMGRLDLSALDMEAYDQRRDILLHPPKQKSFIVRWLSRLWKIIKKLFSRSKKD